MNLTTLKAIRAAVAVWLVLSRSRDLQQGLAFARKYRPDISLWQGAINLAHGKVQRFIDGHQWLFRSI